MGKEGRIGDRTLRLKLGEISSKHGLWEVGLELIVQIRLE